MALVIHEMIRAISLARAVDVAKGSTSGSLQNSTLRTPLGGNDDDVPFIRDISEWSHQRMGFTAFLDAKLSSFPERLIAKSPGPWKALVQVFQDDISSHTNPCKACNVDLHTYFKEFDPSYSYPQDGSARAGSSSHPLASRGRAFRNDHRAS